MLAADFVKAEIKEWIKSQDAFYKVAWETDRFISELSYRIIKAYEDYRHLTNNIEPPISYDKPESL